MKRSYEDNAVMNLRNKMMVAAGVGFGTIAALAAGAKTVHYRGAVVSSQVRVIEGRPYVPLADMARVLDGRVVAHRDGFEIVTQGSAKPGGTNEVGGQIGKVGEWLFNGYWRFRVDRVERMSQYAYHLGGLGSVVKPNTSNEELVVLTCEIRNGQHVAEQPILSESGTSAQKTALADEQGNSYAPQDFDARNGALEPGAAKTFAVIFSPPKDARLKSLIFTLYGFGNTSTKASNVRVLLGP
jgi:hypothetical protein